jgi:hypothetical protein
MQWFYNCISTNNENNKNSFFNSWSWLHRPNCPNAIMSPLKTISKGKTFKFKSFVNGLFGLQYFLVSFYLYQFILHPIYSAIAVSKSLLCTCSNYLRILLLHHYQNPTKSLIIYCSVHSLITVAFSSFWY